MIPTVAAVITFGCEEVSLYNTKLGIHRFPNLELPILDWSLLERSNAGEVSFPSRESFSFRYGSLFL